MKLLVIEDELQLQDSIRISLEKEKFVVDVASDYHSALQKIYAFEYDCIILDILLPFGSGLDILQVLKKEEKPGNIIIISAKDSLDDKITGLEFGADDYMTKPFHNAELNARVKAVMRRKSLDGKNTVSIANVLLDYDERTVTVDQALIDINRKEFDTLSYLVLNKNRLVTHVALAEHVWGDHVEDADNFDFIYSQIKNLRKKLKDCNAGVRIRSVYGVGYKMVEI
ncbi:MAG TPA: response regulator transcription factor [Membranihabitans sp.]|nr:response regulator transcription factor [Membranihabitans sp.]